MSDIGFNFQLEFWHWLILAAALAGIEILTPGFFFSTGSASPSLNESNLSGMSAPSRA